MEKITPKKCGKIIKKYFFNREKCPEKCPKLKRFF